MTMTNPALQRCSVCMNDFSSSGDYAPRILSCSHTFCTKCISKILSEDKKCPTCRKSIAQGSALDVTYNRSAMELLENYSPPAKRRKLNKSEVTIENDDGKYLSIGVCPEHNAPLHFRCVPSKQWICGICHLKSHMSDECRVILVSEALEDMELDNILWIEKREKILDKQRTDMKLFIDVNLEHIEFLKKQIEVSKKTHEILQKKLNCILEEQKKKNNLKAEIKSTRKLIELSNKPRNAKGQLRNFLKKLPLLSSQNSDLVKPVSIIQDVFKILHNNKKVFAQLKCDDGMKFAAVEQRGKMLLVHCLQERKIKSDDIVISYTSVAPIIPKDADVPLQRKLPKVFMKLSVVDTGDTDLGTVVLQMDVDCQRVRNFLALCSGQYEANYLRTQLFSVKGTVSIIGGFDLLKEKQGSVINGINDDGCQRNGEEGRLYGRMCTWGDHSGFGIVFQNPSFESFVSYGTVIEGLHALKNADKERRNSYVVLISHCGLMIQS